MWKLTGSGPYLDFPHFFDGQLQPVDASKVPPELSEFEFPLDKTILTREFNGLGEAAEHCYSVPGPADPTLYCAQSAVNGYWYGILSREYASSLE